MPSHSIFKQVAGRLQNNSRRLQQQSFTANDSDAFPFLQSDIKKLKREYEGRNIEEVFCGKEVDTPAGICYVIESDEPLRMRRECSLTAQNAILSDLTLIHGIGGQKQKQLKSKGFMSIPDLLRHPKYCNKAGDFMEMFEAGDTADLMRWISHWHQVSHPLNLQTSLYHRNEDFVFFDIETLGFFSRPIILFGTGRTDGEKIYVSQYLIRDIQEEPAAISATIKALSGDNPALVTYNGRSFDMPYLNDRTAYYGLPPCPKLTHYDLLHFARRRWKGTFPDCKLSTIEERICGITREDDLPGAMVPEFYNSYMRTKNPGPLVPVVEHNRQDIISLARIYLHLLEERHECP